MLNAFSPPRLSILLCWALMIQSQIQSLREYQQERNKTLFYETNFICCFLCLVAQFQNGDTCAASNTNLELCCPTNGYQCGYVFPPLPGSRTLGGNSCLK